MPDLRAMVFEALDNAVVNGEAAFVVTGLAYAVADDLLDLDADIAAAAPARETLIALIEEWREQKP